MELSIREFPTYEAPWSHAVLRALELEQYQALPEHDDQFTARALGIGASQVRQCLQLLVAAGQIEKKAAHFAVTSAPHIDTPNERVVLVNLQLFDLGAPAR